MTLTQLNYLITIAETGSMNKAAQQLYVSQPSLTSAIRELEAELGITLLYRSGKGVTLTNDGAEFLLYARQIYGQYEKVLEKYGKGGSVKKKFGVSTQHYSFAVKAFVDMAKEFDMAQYEFAIRETRTGEVITDVSTLRSEIGILYLCNFNRKAMTKLLRAASLEFHHLIDCRAYVYLWKNHPLAGKKSICFEELKGYPCLSFDRATMLNLMIGLNGYTLCSGIICEELNGSDYTAVPFQDDEKNSNSVMEIGYVTRENTILSRMGERYIAAIKRYLSL